MLRREMTGPAYEIPARPARIMGSLEDTHKNSCRQGHCPSRRASEKVSLAGRSMHSSMLLKRRLSLEPNGLTIFGHHARSAVKGLKHGGSVREPNRHTIDIKRFF
jgi:hypothetical protein